MWIFWSIVTLMIAVIVHEFGHDWFARKFGVYVREFAIGFGPAFYQRKRKDNSLFSIRLFPLGGYCAIGEDKNEIDALDKIALWKQIFIISGGALFNLLFAFLIAFIMAAGMPAAFFEILSVFAESTWFILTETMKVLAHLQFDQLSSPIGLVSSLNQEMPSVNSMLGTMRSLLTLSFIINIALAVSNMLPIPALDGGRLVGVLIRRIIKQGCHVIFQGKKTLDNQRLLRIEGKIQVAGLWLLLSGTCILLYRDIFRSFQ